MDLSNKKFTITLPTLIGIVSAISTIVGAYWYFKNTIESTKSGIVSANENYKELKEEIKYLREQLYQMAITYNKNVQLENEIHQPSEIKTIRPTRYEYDSTYVTPTIKYLKTSKKQDKVRDTIDLTRIKVKPNIPIFKR